MKKAVALCACALVVMTGLSGASAVRRVNPAIDRYPSVVRFRATPLISGYSDAPSDSIVKLQKRRRNDDSWNVVDKRRVGTSPRVRFRLRETRYTADYRYVVDRKASERVRIRVRPLIKINARPSNVLVNRRVVIAGSLRPAKPGRSGIVKWKVDGNWRRLTRVKLGDGSFRVKRDARRYGRRPVKVVFPGDTLNSYGKDRDKLRVHRRSLATWYGPGFFGRRTACGQRYRRDLLGVAHRTLRCGTEVSVLYQGRSVRVPVVDRGPYGEADWDLTEETADRLGFRGRERIGVLH